MDELYFLGVERLSSSNVSKGEGTSREEADWYIGEEALSRDKGVLSLGVNLRSCDVLSGIFSP